jgi:hypothetical protein
MKININKLLIILTIFTLIVIALFFANANRYYVQVTGGKTLKIDKWTGKTQILTDYGFTEIPYKSNQEIEDEISSNIPISPEAYPLYQLDLIDFSIEGDLLKINIKNNGYKDAKNIKVRYKAFKDKTESQQIDTEDYILNGSIPPGETKSFSILNTLDSSSDWITTEIIEATY